MTVGRPRDRPQPQSDENQIRVLGLMIERADARIAFQSQDIDSHDTKVLAFMAVDLAGAAVLTGVRDSLPPWWWVPLIGLAISATCLASTLWPRLFDSGPNLRQFYDKWGGSSALDVHRQMMGELLDAIDKNKRILPGKERAFNIGVGVLAFTVVVGAIFLRVSTVAPGTHQVRSSPTVVRPTPTSPKPHHPTEGSKSTRSFGTASDLADSAPGHSV